MAGARLKSEERAGREAETEREGKKERGPVHGGEGVNRSGCHCALAGLKRVTVRQMCQTSWERRQGYVEKIQLSHTKNLSDNFQLMSYPLLSHLITSSSASLSNQYGKIDLSAQRVKFGIANE